MLLGSTFSVDGGLDACVSIKIQKKCTEAKEIRICSFRSLSRLIFVPALQSEGTRPGALTRIESKSSKHRGSRPGGKGTPPRKRKLFVSLLSRVYTGEPIEARRSGSLILSTFKRPDTDIFAGYAESDQKKAEQAKALVGWHRCIHVLR
jgi:hypothetical protein